MKIETLRVTWKYIRWAGQGRTPKTYCHYVIENDNHKHKLKVFEKSALFKLLHETRIYKDPNQGYQLLVDGIYKDGRLLYIQNHRVL